MLEFRDASCPCCGEPVELALDASAGGQRYVEDCPVCCRPMTVVLDVDADGGIGVQVFGQDESGS